MIPHEINNNIFVCVAKHRLMKKKRNPRDTCEKADQTHWKSKLLPFRGPWNTQLLTKQNYYPKEALENLESFFKTTQRKTILSQKKKENNELNFQATNYGQAF